MNPMLHPDRFLVREPKLVDQVMSLNDFPSSLRINPKIKPMQAVLLDKHYLRKHGKNAYYGQK